MKMNKTPKSEQSENAKSKDSDIELRLSVSELRATVAEKYCTKDDMRDVKQDVNTRIDDVWKAIRGILIPLVVALLGLIGVIMYLIVK